MDARGPASSPCRRVSGASPRSLFHRCASIPTASFQDSGLPRCSSRRRGHPAPPFCPDERPELVAPYVVPSTVLAAVDAVVIRIIVLITFFIIIMIIISLCHPVYRQDPRYLVPR